MLQPKIYHKIDWFSAVFNDCSVVDALNAIQYECAATTDVAAVFNQRMMISSGYLADLQFSFDGIMIRVHYNDVLSAIPEIVSETDLDNVGIDFFDLKFKYIRLEMSGSVLDMVRSVVGKDYDDRVLFHPMILPDGASCHVTRVDFAFDLINYQGHFLDECIRLCRDNSCPETGRVMTTKRGGCMCSIREMDQKTLYMGSPSSDRLLRIYDKKLQFERSGKLGTCPYNVGNDVPDTWIRIELQCRRDRECHKILYGAYEPLQVLRYIYDTFAICEKINSYKRQIAPAWVNLWNWEEIPAIIQNANCIDYISRVDRAERYIMNTCFGNLAILISKIGWNEFRKKIDSKFEQLQLSEFSGDIKRFNGIMANILFDSHELPEHLIHENNLLRLGD